MGTHRIAVIPGDGIGKETVPEGIRVLDAAARKFGFELQFDHFDFSSWHYFEKHGKMLPIDWKDQIGGHDAIYFGAVGWPEKIPDHIRCGARCSCFGASSTNTSTCARPG